MKKCLGPEDHPFYWTGHQQRLYRSSKVTAIGYEVAWDFVDLVSRSGMTFSGFVGHKTAEYQNAEPSSDAFLAESSFVKAWFGWASQQHIDFRQGSSWCGYQPTILACDGTQLGIRAGQLSIKPIYAPSSSGPPIRPPMDSRLDRCFLRSVECGNAQTARQFRLLLKEVSQQVLTQKAPSSQQLLSNVLPGDCLGLYNNMFDSLFPLSFIHSVANCFLTLSFEASLTAFLPTSILIK